MDLGRPRTVAALAALAVAALAWSYWTTFTEIGERWATDAQYSHGFLVPLFAGYLLWRRRHQLASADLQPRWWGVGIVLAGLAMRLVSVFFYQPWLDAGSLLVVLAGVAATAGGRRALIWAAPAILFLVFMIPMPHRFQTVLGGVLQGVATRASTYALQTLGVPAVSEGNVVLLTDTRLEVVEACSGLSMLVTFFALATAVAMLSRRSWPEKLVLFVSAIPIAVLANVARITITGVLYDTNNSNMARTVFHDLAGWLMMPLALVLLIAELYLMDRAVVPGAEATAEHGAPQAPALVA